MLILLERFVQFSQRVYKVSSVQSMVQDGVTYALKNLSKVFLVLPVKHIQRLLGLITDGPFSSTSESRPSNAASFKEVRRAFPVWRLTSVKST